MNVRKEKKKKITRTKNNEYAVSGRSPFHWHSTYVHYESRAPDFHELRRKHPNGKFFFPRRNLANFPRDVSNCQSFPCGIDHGRNVFNQLESLNFLKNWRLRSLFWGGKQALTWEKYQENRAVSCHELVSLLRQFLQHVVFQLFCQLNGASIVCSMDIGCRYYGVRYRWDCVVFNHMFRWPLLSLWSCNFPKIWKNSLEREKIKNKIISFLSDNNKFQQ